MNKLGGKISLKAIIGIVVLLLVMVFAILGLDTVKTYMSGATVGVEPVGVSVSAQGDSAIVTWTSDKESMGIVEYGTSPASLLLRAPETAPSTNHKVNLSPLRAGLSYYLRIRVGDEVFDNNGIPYSFKTKESSEQGEITTPIVVQPTTTPGAVNNQVGDANCTSGVDYNKDGVINSFDMISCRNKQGSGNQTNPVPTTKPVVSGECKSNVDYDGNGTINSFDMVKCLQTSGN